MHEQEMKKGGIKCFSRVRAQPTKTEWWMKGVQKSRNGPHFHKRLYPSRYTKK